MSTEQSIETSFGPMRVWATSASHVGFATENGADLLINNIPYRLRVDFNREGTTRQPLSVTFDEAPGWGMTHYGEVILRRTDGPIGGKEYTWPAFTKVTDQLLPELAAFIVSPFGQDLIAEGELVEAEREVENAKAEVRQAQADAARAVERRDAADRALHKLRAERAARATVTSRNP